MECKKALVEAGGDIEQAAEAMRISGQAKADKKLLVLLLKVSSKLMLLTVELCWLKSTLKRTSLLGRIVSKHLQKTLRKLLTLLMQKLLKKLQQPSFQVVKLLKKLEKLWLRGLAKTS